jgi:hypothetical protein
MWKKSALKRLFKLLPKTNFSDQLIAAISHDYDNEVTDLKTNEDKYADMFEDIQEATVIKDQPAEKPKKEKKPEPEIFNEPPK